jgi:hypothetical protein
MNSDPSPAHRVVPPIPTFSDVEDFDSLRPAEEVIAEISALNEAADVVDNRGDTDEARRLVGAAFVDRSPYMSTIEDIGVGAAMTRILGENTEPFLVGQPSGAALAWEARVLQTVLHAWTEWTLGRPEAALTSLPRLRAAQHDQERVTARSGAVNLMAMYYWLTAVERLAAGETSEAKRWWKRALEVGSHFGTKSHLVISWTYAASFFPSR